MLSIKLLESDRVIATKINRALADELGRSLHKAAPKLKSAVSPVIASALYASPEIRSLQGGTLKADFGLTSDPSQAIVSAVVSSIYVQVVKPTSSAQNIRGGLKLHIQPSNFENLFGLGVGVQPIKSGALPWLEWLLKLGDSIIVADFGVEYGPFGRTGMAHMSKKRAPFRVRSEFSGTIGNNFVTRALSSVSSEIKNIIMRTI